MLVLGGDPAVKKGKKGKGAVGSGCCVEKHTYWEPHPTAMAGAGSQHWPKDTADLRGKVPAPPNPFKLPGPGQRKMEVHSTTGAPPEGMGQGGFSTKGFW